MGFESSISGAEAWISADANILRSECGARSSLPAGGKVLDGARPLQSDPLPAIRLVGGHGHVSATRAALEMMGFEKGRPRLPRPEDGFTEVAEILHSVGLIGRAA